MKLKPNPYESHGVLCDHQGVAEEISIALKNRYIVHTDSSDRALKRFCSVDCWAQAGNCARVIY